MAQQPSNVQGTSGIESYRAGGALEPVPHESRNSGFGIWHAHPNQTGPGGIRKIPQVNGGNSVERARYAKEEVDRGLAKPGSHWGICWRKPRGGGVSNTRCKRESFKPIPLT
jgi:hypothetical protein